jgi:hypothetical protein
MPKRLLDRQVSLLDYLTSSPAIFDKSAPAAPRQLDGIDPVLLHFEARFSYDKRMEKISAAFSRTLEILGNAPGLLRSFAEACPPTDISRLANARQFHAFLSDRWRRKVPKPPHVRDVARCELAFAEVRAQPQEDADGGGIGDERGARPAIRRHPGSVLLRCQFDVRPVFEQGAVAQIPSRRDTRLAVTMPSGAEQPLVFEISPIAFDLVATLGDWVDRSALGAMHDSRRLIRELASHGILEVRG